MKQQKYASTSHKTHKTTPTTNDNGIIDWTINILTMI